MMVETRVRAWPGCRQVFDDRHHVLVFGHDLVLFQAGEALQAHLQDFLGLGLRQAVQAILAMPECFPGRRVGSRRH